MIKNIVKTEYGFRATIGEQEWFIPNDPQNRYFQTVQEAISSGEPFVDESAKVVENIAELTFAQLLIGLVKEDLISEPEGEAWLAGLAPQIVTDLIATLPEENQFAAKARALRPSSVLRSDPLVSALAQIKKMSPAELDTFFNTYAGV
jgi:hypothetical protein